MNTEEFREFGRAAVDYIADYLDNIRDRNVLPSVEPGYLQKLIPTELPKEGEDWKNIMRDMDSVIMPGITHWQSPQFHAYFPTAGSLPSVIGEMLSNGLGIVGFSWITSPACTELEVAVMNWLGKLLGIPEHFLNCSQGPGGGIIQGSASESTLISILAAKRRTILRMKSLFPNMSEHDIKGKLIAYSSDQSNSSIEKSGVIGDVQMRLLKSDEYGSLRGQTLQEAIEEDVANGNIPCSVIATLGTTGICAFDNLEELGPICQEYNIWLHIDAAYAGPVLMLPEYSYLKKGLEFADSFDFNPHKWLLVNFDCSAMWVKDANCLLDTFFVDRIYLRHTDNSYKLDTQAPDYMHWQIPLGRRFRALKLWITLRIYGVQGLKEYLRKQINMANQFAQMVQNDNRFEFIVPPSMALVCFKIKGDNELTKQLHERLMSRKKIYLVKASFQNKLMLRFVICSRMTEEYDVEYAWNEIVNQTEEILKENGGEIQTENVLKQNGEEIQTEDIFKQNGVELQNEEVLKRNGGCSHTNSELKGMTETNLIHCAKQNILNSIPIAYIHS